MDPLRPEPRNWIICVELESELVATRSLPQLPVCFPIVLRDCDRILIAKMVDGEIYGIANTHADFMLFRNGFKLIFSLKEPGAVSVRFHYVGAGFQQTAASVAPVGAAPRPSS